MGNLYGKFLGRGEQEETLFALEEGRISVRIDSSRDWKILRADACRSSKVFQSIDGDIVERSHPRGSDTSLTVFPENDPEGRVFEVEYHRTKDDLFSYSFVLFENGRTGGIGINTQIFDRQEDIDDVRFELGLRILELDS